VDSCAQDEEPDRRQARAWPHVKLAVVGNLLNAVGHERGGKGPMGVWMGVYRARAEGGWGRIELGGRRAGFAGALADGFSQVRWRPRRGDRGA